MYNFFELRRVILFLCTYLEKSVHTIGLLKNNLNFSFLRIFVQVVTKLRGGFRLIHANAVIFLKRIKRYFPLARHLLSYSIFNKTTRKANRGKSYWDFPLRSVHFNEHGREPRS